LVSIKTVLGKDKSIILNCVFGIHDYTETRNSLK
jgi:hypothetical protein